MPENDQLPFALDSQSRRAGLTLILVVKRTRVRSSMLASIGYDAEHSTLELEFRSGHVYDYFAVPRHVFRGLLDAESKGQFFHAKIDGTYPFVEVAARH